MKDLQVLDGYLCKPFLQNLYNYVSFLGEKPVVVLRWDMDSELLLLSCDVFADTVELFDLHLSFDRRFVYVKYLRIRDHQKSLLGPCVLVDLLYFVAEDYLFYKSIS